MEMMREPELLEDRLRQHDEQFHQAVAKLKQAAKQPLGLAHRIRNDPLPWLAGALLIGLWVGSKRG